MEQNNCNGHSDDSKIKNQIIRGLPFPLAPWFPKQHIVETLDYQPQDGDIIIASYPKTGTTWLQFILIQIVSEGELYPTNGEAVKVLPFMECNGIAAIEALKYRPRMYKHHCPYNMVKKNKKSKVIYIYRHPEDTLVSYYFFNQELFRNSDLELDQHFEDFVSGDVGYGSYFKHVLSYHDHKEDGNLLMVSYEDLLMNRKEGILRIAKFLSEEYFEKLSSDADLLEAIVECTGFDYMKKHIPVIHTVVDESKEELKRVNFFRKGKSGYGKEHLSVEQRDRLKELALDLLKDTNIVKEWYKGY